MVQADTGLAKSERAMDEIVHLLEADPSRRVAYVVPEHQLAGDLARRFDAMAGRPLARVYRGLQQPDPDDPSARMCRRYAEDGLSEYLALGGRLDRLCGGRKRGFCRHHPDNPGRAGPACAYVPQRRSRSRLWIVPAALLTAKVPVALRRDRDEVGADPAGAAAPREGAADDLLSPIADPRHDFDLVVIDEAPWLQLVGGFGPGGYAVPLRALDRPEFGRVADRHEGEDAAVRLVGTCREVRARLLRAASGPIPDEALAGLDAAACAEAARLVWRARRALDADPAAGREQVERGVAGVREVNRAVGRCARLFRTLAWRCADLTVTPAAAIERADLPGPATGNLRRGCGPAEPGVLLRWREEIDPTWDRSAVVVLDATGDVEVARWWLPGLEPLGRAWARLPHARVVQLVDRSLRYGSFTGGSRAAVTNRTRVRLLVRTIEVLAGGGHGRAPGEHDVLVVVPLAVRRTLEGGQGGDRLVGPRTGLLHFGVERGVDAFGRVLALVVASRPLPSVADLEALAEICSGRRLARRVPPGEGYPRRTVRRLPRFEPCQIGRFYRLGVEIDRLPADRLVAQQLHHPDPDPDAERVRWQVCEAALMQAVGRARAVNRTARDPVLIVVLTDVPLPIEIDAVLAGRELAGDVLTLVANALGMIPGDQRTLAALLPGVYQAGARSVEHVCAQEPALAGALAAIRRGEPVWLPWGELAMPAVIRGRRGSGRAASVRVAVRPGPGRAGPGDGDAAAARIAAAVGIEGARLVAGDPVVPARARPALLRGIDPDAIGAFPELARELVVGEDGVVRDREGRRLEAREVAGLVLEAAERAARARHQAS
jgi:hypothetical protein